MYRFYNKLYTDRGFRELAGETLTDGTLFAIGKNREETGPAKFAHCVQRRSEGGWNSGSYLSVPHIPGEGSSSGAGAKFDILISDAEVRVRISNNHRGDNYEIDKIVEIDPKDIGGQGERMLVVVTGDIRPIAVGSLVTRVIAKCVNSSISKRAREMFIPLGQLGIAVPHGIELAVMALQVAIQRKVMMGKKVAVLQIDLENAFNRTSRKRILEMIHEYFPELMDWTDWLYSKPTKLHFQLFNNKVKKIISQRGVRQGDPLGSFYHALNMHITLEALQTLPGLREARERDDVVQVAYHDDCNMMLCGDSAEEVVRLVEAVWTALPGILRQTDGRLSKKKSKILTLSEDVYSLLKPRRHDLGFADRNMILWNPEDETTEVGLDVLGCPIGSKAFVTKHVENLVYKRDAGVMAKLRSQKFIKHSHSLCVAEAIMNCCCAQTIYHTLRMVDPELSSEAAHIMDDMIMRTTARYHVDEHKGTDPTVQGFVRLPSRTKDGCRVEGVSLFDGKVVEKDGTRRALRRRDLPDHHAYNRHLLPARCCGGRGATLADTVKEAAYSGRVTDIIYMLATRRNSTSENMQAQARHIAHLLPVWIEEEILDVAKSDLPWAATFRRHYDRLHQIQAKNVEAMGKEATDLPGTKLGEPGIRCVVTDAEIQTVTDVDATHSFSKTLVEQAYKPQPLPPDADFLQRAITRGQNRLRLRSGVHQKIYSDITHEFRARSLDHALQEHVAKCKGRTENGIPLRVNHAISLSASAPTARIIAGQCLGYDSNDLPDRLIMLTNAQLRALHNAKLGTADPNVEQLVRSKVACKCGYSWAAGVTGGTPDCSGVHFTACNSVLSTSGIRTEYHDRCVDILADVIRAGRDRGTVGQGPFVSKMEMLATTAAALRRSGTSDSLGFQKDWEDNRMPDIRWSESEQVRGQRETMHYSLDVSFRCISTNVPQVACTCSKDGLTQKYGKGVCCCFGRYRRPGMVAESKGDVPKIRKHRDTELAQGREFCPFTVEQAGAYSSKARALLKRLVKRVYDRSNHNAAFYPGVFRRGVHRRLVSNQSRLHASLLVQGPASVTAAHHRGRRVIDESSNDPCSLFGTAD